MRTAGLMMNDIWAHRLMTEKDAVTTSTSAQLAEISLLVETADMLHRGPAEKFRPYLHLSGELVGVNFTEPLGYGVNELTYKPGTGGKIDAYYEFDDEQLVVLARKGYFNSSFEVPHQITGVQWQLPALVDTLTVAPDQEGESPLVFVKVHDAGKFELDLESSEYDLTDYFADFSKKGVEPVLEAVGELRGARARTDEMKSLFDSEITLDETESVQRRAPAAAVVVETSPEIELEAQLAEAKNAVSNAHAKHGEHLATIEGTTDNLYASRVASAVEPVSEELVFIDPARLSDLGLKTEDPTEIRELTRAKKRAEARRVQPDVPAHLADADEEFGL